MCLIITDFHLKQTTKTRGILVSGCLCIYFYSRILISIIYLLTGMKNFVANVIYLRKKINLREWGSSLGRNACLPSMKDWVLFLALLRCASGCILQSQYTEVEAGGSEFKLILGPIESSRLAWDT
ncbi:mCG1050903 [Mus musculus]|nr:mCG1050903 [Mus musculus]